MLSSSLVYSRFTEAPTFSPCRVQYALDSGRSEGETRLYQLSPYSSPEFIPGPVVRVWQRLQPALELVLCPGEQDLLW